jgi:hypothetical protein
MKVLGIFAPLALVASASVGAQSIPRSQPGSVSQSVAGTQIEIAYRRPTARGRALFGALVPWGRLWSPSADTAASVTFSAPVQINGAPLAAGTYSLWAVPDSASWTLVFNSIAHVHHLRYPGEEADALRLKVSPVTGEHVESLIFAFPMVDADSARLELRWGTTVLPMLVRARR